MLGEEKFKWNLNDVFNIFILVFVLELVLFILLKLFGAEDIVKTVSAENGMRSLVLFLIYLVQVAGMIIPLWYIAVKKKHAKLEDFGFRWIKTYKAILWVIGGYIFYIGLGTLILLVFYELGIGSLGFEPQKPVFEIFGSDLFGIIIASIIALVIAPLTEELFFRGFMLQTISKNISPVWGVILTTMIFAAVHFEFESIMPLLILSFVLNVLFIKTKSIWPGIIFHVLNNTIAFIIVLFGIVV